MLEKICIRDIRIHRRIMMMSLLIIERNIPTPVSVFSSQVRIILLRNTSQYTFEFHRHSRPVLFSGSIFQFPLPISVVADEWRRFRRVCGDHFLILGQNFPNSLMNTKKSHDHHRQPDPWTVITLQRRQKLKPKHTFAQLESLLFKERCRITIQRKYVDVDTMIHIQVGNSGFHKGGMTIPKLSKN